MKSGKKLYRIIAFLLALLFILITCGSAITLIANAAFDKNVKIRVGIAYGSSASTKYTFTVANGLSVGIMTDKRTFKKLGEYPSLRSLAVMPEKNSTSGQYHLQVSGSYTSYAKAYDVLKALKDKGVSSAFIAFVSNTFRVRVGSYTSSASATSAKSSVPMTTSVVTESGSGTVLYDVSAKKVVFECDTSGIWLGVRALQKVGFTKPDYIKVANGYMYDGVMEFSRSGSSVQVVSVVDIDQYVAGVLPWEIYPQWPEETIKAFACTMRALGLYHYGARHNSKYGFDVCGSSHCQNYKGMSRYYDSFQKAVAETAGEFVTYNDKPIMAIYHGTNGGVTEDVRDIWGGNVLYPYLVSVTIPIEVENRANQPTGVWQSEVDPTTLLKYLQSGSSAAKSLTAPIVALNVLKYSKYSGVYIYSLQFVDANGKTATVNTSSNVRSALVKYCSSAYFKISYNYNLSVKGADSSYTGKLNSAAAKVLTKDGEFSAENTSPQNLRILTKDGTKSLSTDSYTIVFDGFGNGHGGGISMYGAVDLAKAGYTYDEIVKTYFQQTEITALGKPDPEIDYVDDGVDDVNDDEIGEDDGGEFTDVYDMITVTASELNIRKEPNTSSSKLGTARSGAEFIRTGKGSLGWERILLSDGTVAYVSSSYIKESANSPDGDFEKVSEKIVANADISAFDNFTDGASVLETLKKDTRMTRVGVGSGDFDRVILPSGKAAYVKKADVSPYNPEQEEEKPQEITFEDVNELVKLKEKATARKEPSEYAEDGEAIASGTVLVRTGVGSEGFDRIITPTGSVAYVKKDVLEICTDTPSQYTDVKEDVVTTTAVNLRSEPNTSSQIVKTLSKGTVLVRTGVGSDGWDRVAYDGITAYIKSEYVKLNVPVSPTEEFTPCDMLVKTTANLYFREAPSTLAKSVQIVPKDTVVVKTGEGKNGFDRVRTPDGVVCYASSEYLEPYNSVYTGYIDVRETVEVITAVNLRTGPGTDYDKVKVASIGSEYTRIGRGGEGWDKLELADKTVVYVKAEYVKAVME